MKGLAIFFLKYIQRKRYKNNSTNVNYTYIYIYITTGDMIQNNTTHLGPIRTPFFYAPITINIIIYYKKNIVPLYLV